MTYTQLYSTYYGRRPHLAIQTCWYFFFLISPRKRKYVMSIHKKRSRRRFQRVPSYGFMQKYENGAHSWKKIKTFL